MITYEFRTPDKTLQDSTVEEIERYVVIANHFAKKSNRDRYYGINIKCLEEMHDRLSALKGETLPEHISDLCSKLLKRFDAGIL